MQKTNNEKGTLCDGPCNINVIRRRSVALCVKCGMTLPRHLSAAQAFRTTSFPLIKSNDSCTCCAGSPPWSCGGFKPWAPTLQTSLDSSAQRTWFFPTNSDVNTQ